MQSADCWHRNTYDALDSLKSWTLPGVRDYADYQYSARNLPEQIKDSSNNTVVNQSFDPQGNLSAKNGQAYIFDFGNRLREVVGKQWSRYDGYGHRVLRWEATEPGIVSLYSLDNQLLYDDNNRASSRTGHLFVYLQGSLLATKERNLDSGAERWTYQHTDALGSPVAITDPGGSVIERTDWEPWGHAIGKPNLDSVGYTGHQMDGSTQLIHMQQRYYDPNTGQFLSQDPVNVDINTGNNFNRRWYANNNPYKFKDPDGRVGFLYWSAPDKVTYTLLYRLQGQGLSFNKKDLEAKIASDFSGSTIINGRLVHITAQAVEHTGSGPYVNIVTIIPTTAGVTVSGRSEINTLGGNRVILGAKGPNSATVETASHELGGHAGGAGDQYSGGKDIWGNSLGADVPGKPNVMKDLGGQPANDQTRQEILRSGFNINQCAKGVVATNGGC